VCIVHVVVFAFGLASSSKSVGSHHSTLLKKMGEDRLNQYGNLDGILHTFSCGPQTLDIAADIRVDHHHHHNCNDSDVTRSITSQTISRDSLIHFENVIRKLRLKMPRFSLPVTKPTFPQSTLESRVLTNILLELVLTFSLGPLFTLSLLSFYPNEIKNRATLQY